MRQLALPATTGFATSACGIAARPCGGMMDATNIQSDQHCKSIGLDCPLSSLPAVLRHQRMAMSPQAKALTLHAMTNTFGARSTLKVGSRAFEIFRLDALSKAGIDVSRLPYSLRILLEDSSAPRMGSPSPGTTSRH